MLPLNIDASSPLKALLTAAGSDASIYINGGLPSAALPDSFILIDPNGGFSTKANKFGNATCVLAVSIYTKLLSTGATNLAKEGIVIGKFQNLFEEVVTTMLGQNSFTYELSLNPVMYSGKSIVSGYSTKIINVNCYINY